MLLRSVAWFSRFLALNDNSSRRWFLVAGTWKNPRDEREREAAADSAGTSDQSDIRLHSATDARRDRFDPDEWNTTKHPATAGGA